jgi:hypothetical protein
MNVPVRKTALRCPWCGESQPLTTISYKESFSCAQCGVRMRVPYEHKRNMGVVTLAVAALVGYVAGMRGWSLLFATIIVFFVLAALFGTVERHWFPPTLELTDDSD